MQKINLRGFTLVELIVVITILAILGTIGFISLQGYALNARDSARVSDLNTISRALEYYHLQENHYPNPTDFYSVSYSGALAWRQGTFGDETRNLTQRISQTPLDPLTKNEYAYSTTNTRQEFELGAITENFVVINTETNPNNNLIPTNRANAVNSYFSYVVGNYNKQIVTAKDTVDTNRLYILGVPTIITSEITDVTVQDILANQSFSVDRSQNLPASYAANLPGDQTIAGNTSFTPGTVTLTAPLIYTGTANDLSDDSNKQQFGEDLKSYYADSDISGQSAYQQLVNTPSGEELVYINTIVQAEMGGVPGGDIVTSLSGGDGGTTPATSVTNPLADPNCYTAAVNTIGSWDGCMDMLIVNRESLIDLSQNISGGLDKQIIGPGGRAFTFGDSADNIFTGQVTDMSFLITRTGGSPNPNTADFNADVGYWDTSRVTSMSIMFDGTQSFNQSLNSWNTSMVEDMSFMFAEESGYNQPLNAWDTSRVTNMGSMFLQAYDFNQPLNDWDTSSVENMSRMFNNATNFDQALNDWDTINVTDMGDMFNAATNFDQALNDWDTINVTDMGDMFSFATSFDQPLNDWDTSSILFSSFMRGMFNGASSFNQDLSQWCVTSIGSKPTFFDSNTPSWDPKPGRQPVWGSCP